MIPQTKLGKARKVFAKYYTAVIAVIITSFYGAITAFAADEAGFDTTEILPKVETALILVVSITGIGIAIFGVLHLIEAQSGNDPNAKSTGIKQLAAGLGMVVIANLLIPVFIGAITF
jgi:hypothetical protein